MFSDGSACKTAVENASKNEKVQNSKAKVKWCLLLSLADMKP